MLSSAIDSRLSGALMQQAVNTVVAGVLHDVVDDTGRDLRDVREHFGDEVARLVAGVSKLSHINQVQSIPFGQGFVDGLSCSQCL
jgi:(p)ppGpp synthase/HD superfamily hydrolase